MATLTQSSTTSISPSDSPAKQPTTNIGTEPPQTQLFLTTLVTVSIVSMAVLGVGLLVYFRKRRFRTELVS